MSVVRSEFCASQIVARGTFGLENAWQGCSYVQHIPVIWVLPFSCNLLPFLWLCHSVHRDQLLVSASFRNNSWTTYQSSVVYLTN
jgi:hypothetical protein